MDSKSYGVTSETSYLGMTLRSYLENHDLGNNPSNVRLHNMDDDDCYIEPNLWDKAMPDIKLEYADLDSFLEENGIHVKSGESVGSPTPSCGSTESYSRDGSASVSDPEFFASLPFDPKPQPTSKKSMKQFVPDDLKDDKYWLRRRKNNIAAKRSREARRVKENQIALRASYLEKENLALKEEVAKLRQNNAVLQKKLLKC